MADSGIDISETTYGLQVKLSPSGRSNGESDPAQWEYNGVETTFEGFDWSSNGWTGESLKLTGGAKAVIGYRLFKDDAGATGATIEMEFRVSGVTDRQAEVISCMDNGKGLSVTSEEASIKTGTILHYTNETARTRAVKFKIGTEVRPREVAGKSPLFILAVVATAACGTLRERQPCPALTSTTTATTSARTIRRASPLTALPLTWS